MKKIFSVLLAVLCTVSCLNLNVQAEEEPEEQSGIWVEEVETDSIYEKEWIIHDGEEEHILKQNLQTMSAMLDEEELLVSVIDVALPMVTIDYSSIVWVYYHIPWQDTVDLVVTAISLLASGVDFSGADTALSIWLTYQPDIYLTFYQYSSSESYYSVSNGVYYNKRINTNVRIRKDSTSGTTLWGPGTGNWFDPIQP